MDKIIVEGGKRLEGEISVSGAKNAALPLMASALLTKKSCRIRNIPKLQDIATMASILEVLGAKVKFEREDLVIDPAHLTGEHAPYDYVRKMRASVLLMGPLLARTGHAHISLPGGCAIGVRPINLHLNAMESMGASVEIEEGYVEAKAKKIKPSKFVFDMTTVTGTMNAMMAACGSLEESHFQNCAREPEVMALADALREMGAEISGDGSAQVKIRGCQELNGFDVDLMPDRIETGTYLVASSLTRGDLFLRRAKPQHLEVVLQKLTETGAEFQLEDEGIRVKGTDKIHPAHVRTSPFPGFPTDMQAQLMVLLSLADGTSVIKETIFENRFMHVAELVRMGADLTIEGSTVTIRGISDLHGAPVMATDLRASASLVLAGLAAKGQTEIRRIYHLDRGYERMEDKLRSVGAEIRRVPQDD